jgi:hypothetical protein
MRIHAQNRRTPLPGWQMWICVLLIGLVLYNPFVALCHEGGSLCYEKLASNRAAVGSGELQHFSPVPDSTEQPDADVDVSRTEPPKTAEESYSRLFEQEVTPMQAEQLAGVWFRPPPQ